MCCVFKKRTPLARCCIHMTCAVSLAVRLMGHQGRASRGIPPHAPRTLSHVAIS